MKQIVRTLIIFLMIASSGISCKKYLNIVPDNTLTLEDIFELKEQAQNALAKVYSYMPRIYDTHATAWTLGDEWVGRLDINDVVSNLRAIRIMRGLQSVTSPQLGMWSGTEGERPVYDGVREADVFIENIDRTVDLSDQQRKDWKAQAKVMKAYYLFMLVKRYGPIVIPAVPATPESSEKELFLERSKVEDCFTFILNLIDEALPDLKESAGQNDLGQVDQVVATAIKAQVLFFRASPFFNGNREYFGDFVNNQGEPYFPMEYNKEKWKEAIDGINAAIQIAETNGHGLYTYEKDPYLYDRDAFSKNKHRMQTLYDLRMMNVDPWNKEVVWGYSNLDYYNQGELANSTNIRLPEGYGDGVTNTATFSWQWMAATYRMTERYYTENGLPIDEDLTFDMSKRQEIVTTPGQGTADYDSLYGIIQPGVKTINLYLNREPRFYANLGITGGYWRAHNVRVNTLMFANTDGGFSSSHVPTDYFCTGIGIKKFVHPESESGAWQRVIKHPYPIIRMADLYLWKAEAINEYSGPGNEVFEAMNKVRRRAGVPDIEKVWADATLTRHPGKHLTQEGLRDIILQEESIEFAFEGRHYWDMIRHKRAPAEFSSPIWGWNHAGGTAEDFFVLSVKQARQFSIRDCLWPIDLNETNTNGNLKQNPGW